MAKIAGKVAPPKRYQEGYDAMVEVNRLTSADAVNEEERKIARDMDDVKQTERMSDDDPKQRQIADMIDRAERTRGETARDDAQPASDGATCP